ncbi:MULTISPECIES: GGDEF domain-containing protein [unclassified Wenzhouxiangella]|uniref:GGDEF domain-containing protein n=1 Tax=unclassified Wenzhouxiangella TaxID=2613841 RepID=UPI000E325298|nr:MULTISPECIES: GGDEF domain-containing protein [unclassified Wenzhouxiangella]RFF26666.1 GGDEF domain-containing protein [Wenzhouxiangella sp. 15181]RFP67583.1 GGDEF domain-containing protein [Wenzhouxiangella sp. 15190]
MTELLLLDVRTLAFASSVSGFLMAATMFGIYLAGLRSRALIDWAIAGLGFGLGYLLGHILQTLEVPVPVWAVASLANSLIGFGHGMVLVGIQRYLGRRSWFWPMLAVVAFMFLSVFVLPELRESLRWRVILQSGFYILLGFYAGGLLWRVRRPGMRLFHRAAAVVIMLFAALLALRFGYALVSPALTTSFVSDPFQIGIFVVSMIYGYALTMALVLVLFREKQVELSDLAEQDALTGLYNRLSLDTIAEREMQRARERKTPLSIVLIDLDHFKDVNDRFGHQVGDRALCRAAELIERVIRDSDFAFRYGGEEFMVLLPGADRQHAEQVAQRLRMEMGHGGVRIDGRQVDLRASFGVVECGTEGASWAECVTQADRALYRAKRGGRDRVELG